MQVTINSTVRELPDASSIQSLLELLSLAGKRIAVERNGEIVPRSHYAGTPLADGDALEIIQAVGGG